MTQVPQEEITLAPTLLLTVVESSVIPQGTSYLINACGYVNSKRNMNDGCVYLGTQEGTVDEQLVNDIVIPESDEGVGQKHLIVKYSMETKQYFIKDLGDGTGTFLKIDKALVLRQKYIISFGDSHMIISLRQEGKIQLRFLDGPKTDQTL